MRGNLKMRGKPVGQCVTDTGHDNDAYKKINAMHNDY